MLLTALSTFYRLIHALNSRLSRGLNILVMLIMAALVIDVLWGVFSRFVLGAQSPWTEELARFLLVWVSLFGASVAFREKKHLGVDVFVNALNPEAKKHIDIFIDMLIIIFVIAVFIIGGSRLVQTSFEMHQQMISLPVSKASFYISLPITGIIILLFSIEDILAKCLNTGLEATQATSSTLNNSSTNKHAEH